MYISSILQVLRKCNMAKTFGQYGTANYNFYTYTKEGFVFLVMVDSTVSFYLIIKLFLYNVTMIVFYYRTLYIVKLGNEPSCDLLTSY